MSKTVNTNKFALPALVIHKRYIARENPTQSSNSGKDNETRDRIYRAHPVISILMDMRGSL